MAQTLRLAVLAFFAAAGFSHLFAQRVTALGTSDLRVGERSFSVAEIVDARRDLSSIGVCRAGLDDRREKIALNRPVADAVLDFFRWKMPDEKGWPEVAYRFTRFAVWEDRAAIFNYAEAAIDAEIFLKKGAAYQKIGAVAARSFVETKRDATLFHDKTMRACLQKIYDSTAVFVAKWQQNDSITTEKNQTLQDLAATFSPKIMTDTAFAEGLFLTLDEFRANAPTGKYRAELRPGKNPFFMVEKIGKPGAWRKIEPDDSYFAVRHAGHFYYFQEGVFFKMEREETGGSFVFEGWDVEKVRKNEMLGGIIGGQIGAEIARNSTKKNNRGAMVVDLETGAFWPKE